MNTKAFITGFNTANSVLNGVSATKRAARGALSAPKLVHNTYEAATSFIAGAKQAIKCHRGTCRVLTYDARSNEEG